jgi:transposase
MIVLASAQGQPARDIAGLIQGSDSYVREVIHAFNQHGFAALDPKWSGGRPKTIDDTTAEQICRIALTRPHSLGEPFTCWSIAKLRDHLVATRVIRGAVLEIEHDLYTRRFGGAREVRPRPGRPGPHG